MPWTKRRRGNAAVLSVRVLAPVAEAMRVPAFGTKPVLEPLLPSPVAELLSELPLFGADPPQLPAPPLSAVPDPDPGPVPDAPSGCFPTAPDPALNPA